MLVIMLFSMHFALRPKDGPGGPKGLKGEVEGMPLSSMHPLARGRDLRAPWNVHKPCEISRKKKRVLHR
jgi:hypothetical protein